MSYWLPLTQGLMRKGLAKSCQQGRARVGACTLCVKQSTCQDPCMPRHAANSQSPGAVPLVNLSTRHTSAAHLDGSRQGDGVQKRRCVVVLTIAVDLLHIVRREVTCRAWQLSVLCIRQTLQMHACASR